MNKTLKGVLIFASGVATGATVMYFGVKKYFEVKADLEVESVREAYNRKIGESEPALSSIEGEISGPETIDDGERPFAKPSRSLDNPLNNKPPLTDYTKYFHKEDSYVNPSDLMIEQDLAESESPEDDEPYSDEEDAEQQMEYETYQINEEHKKAVEDHVPPHVIDASDFELTCTHYDKVSLVYYMSDDVLVDDSGITPEEVNRFELVDTCLRDSGFDDNDDDVLYVRNDYLQTDYEITKVFTPYLG